MKAELPDVFAYLDFRAYLRAWFDAKKAKNARFSHRLFSRRAGVSSPSTLVNVMEGRRNLGPEAAESFAAAMDLEPEASEFFLALVRMQCADDASVRARSMEQVRATQRFRDARRESQALEFIATWYLPALHELSACVGFVGDPTYIAATLRPSITEAQARQALETLVDLGLLVKGDRLERATASVATPHEVAGLAAREYHRGMMLRALDSLDYTSTERHLCGVTVAIPAELAPTIKKELDAFQERILDLCDSASGDRSLVVQVNLQMVPLSYATARPK